MKCVAFLIPVLAAQAALADGVTFVDQCGVSSSENYQSIIVTANLELTNFGAPCIDISHEFVTLDCQGNELSAPLGGAGIGVRVTDEAHDVIVKDCVFSGYFLFGITSQAHSGLIEHNELEIAGFGMIFSGSGNEVRHNKIKGGGWVGMDFSYSDHNSVHHNSVHDKQGGIFLRHSSFSEIFQNVLIGNSGVGLLFSDESNANDIVKNRAINNGLAGLRLGESYGNFVANNVANGNAMGIEEEGKDLETTYEGNVCRANEIADSNIEGACK